MGNGLLGLSAPTRGCKEQGEGRMGSSQPEDGTHKAIPEMDAAATKAVNRLADALFALAQSNLLLARAYAGQDDDQQADTTPTTDMAGRPIR